MIKEDKEKGFRILIYLCIFLSTFNISYFTVDIFLVQVSLFRIMIAITILLGYFLKRKELFKIDRTIKYYVVFLFAWLMYAVISLIWVKDYLSWLQTLYFLFLGFSSILLFTKFIINKKFLYNCFFIFSIATIIHIVLGMNEYFFDNYYFIKLEYLDKYLLNSWPVTTFTNTNNYAFYLGLCLCVFIFIIKYSSNKYIKIFYSIFTLLLLFLICTTESRGVILALIVSIWIVLLNKFILINKRKLFNTIIISTCCIAAVCLVVVLINGFSNVSNFQNPSNSNSIRLNLTFNSFYFTYKSYFLGVGAGNFEYYIMNYALFNTDGIINSHNWLLEILSEYGLCIFIGYLYFIFKFFKQTQVKLKNEFNNFFQYISLLFLAIFIVGSISPSSIMHMEWMWILFALFICGGYVCSEEDLDESIVCN